MIQRKKIVNPCKICGKHRATQKHHCFPQTKMNRKLYGWLLDEEFNVVEACGYCNSSHANIPDEFRWDECRFRTEAWKAGYRLPPPSKVYQTKKLSGAISEAKQ